MRRNRRMTSNDRLEVGMFMSLLVAGFIILTAAVKMGGLPAIIAWNSSEPKPASYAPPTLAPEASPMRSIPQLQMQTIPQIPQNANGQLSMTPPALPLSAEQTATGRTADPVPTLKSRETSKPQPEIKIFDGEKYRFVRTLKLRVTAYAPDPRCTYPFPGTTTASGKSVKTNGGRLVAADTSLIPMHALVAVPGYARGSPVPVLDRGGAIKGSRLDILLPTFNQAQDWGTKELEVKVFEPAK